MRLSKRTQVAVLLVLATVFLSVAGIIVYKKRAELIHNQVVQNFVPFFHSLRKLPDIFFFPYYLRGSQLTVYTLSISGKDMQTLNAGLPSDPFGTMTLNDVARVQVKGGFQTSDGFEENSVTVRYRGSISNNWNTAKRSYQIDFPNNNLFHGMKEISLYIPSDREYFAEALNTYRAQKLGLTVPTLTFVRLYINNQDYGVYIVAEHWSQEWLEKNRHSADSNILGPNSGVETGGKFVWQSWNIPEAAIIKKPKSQALTGAAVTDVDSTEVLVKTLTDVVEHTSDKDFERYLPYILDMKKFYAMETINILAGTYHSDGYASLSNNPNVNDSGDNNLVLIFDTDKGLFEPVPYNVAIAEAPEGGITEIPSYLTRRIYSIPAFLSARNEVLKKYISDPKNLADDMAFVDRWQKNIEPEIFTDNVKLENNFEVRNIINQYRSFVSVNFSRAQSELSKSYDRPAVDVQPITFSGSFAFLAKTAVSPSQFVASNPEFYLSGDGIHLSGTHTFNRTVTVPKGTRLTIDSGARLYFAKDVSFVSYSPVTARGGLSGIRMLPAGSAPWGNFAVANTDKDKSFFDNVYLNGGGDTHVNGIHMSGTLSFQSADADINNVTVEDAQGDDGIHITHGAYSITNSTFHNNWADPIDSDFTTSTFSNNAFINTVPVSTLSYDGDAMDMSGSTITVKDNVVYGMGDKGISVGEGSDVVAVGNIVAGSVYGAAVKDLSRATFTDNIFVNNKTGIALYQKKAIWGGGTATSTGSVMYGNGVATNVDKKSVLHEEGTINATEEAVRSRIPASIRSLVFKR